ncbi:MAG TPA: VanW family protein [bacterium]|nr:VanW family protein [bacterium]
MSKKHKKKWQNRPDDASQTQSAEPTEVSAVLVVNSEDLAKTLENALPDQNKELNLIISEPKKPLPWKGILFFALGVGLLVGLNFGLQYGMSYYFKNKILPGVTVNGTQLAYMSYDDAWQTLNNRWESYWQSADWEILDKPAPVTAFPSEDENLAKQDDIVVLKFLADQNYCRLDETVLREQVFAYGQNQWWIKSLPLLWQDKDFAIPLACDSVALNSFLNDKLLPLESPGENARYQFDAAGNLTIVEGKVGRVVDYEDLLSQIKTQLPLMQDLSLSLKWQIEDPQVRGSDLEAFKNTYLSYLEKSVELQLPKWTSGLDSIAVTRSYDDMRNSNPEDLTKYYNTAKDIYNFTTTDLRIDAKELAAKAADLSTVATLKIKNFADDIVFYKDDKNQLMMKINEEDLGKWLGDVNENIKIEAVSAILEMEEVTAPVDSEAGETEATKKYRVKKFVSPKAGRALNIEESVSLLNALFQAEEFAEKLSLPVVFQSPTDENLPNNPLKIQELVGLGVSNFSGSPANRIHNIKTGAGKLNGLLLAPGEEFKTIINLKPFTAGGGYLPELVIKGTETIPEYGGGLCQVGTTLFRAAIDAGLPITERRPHRYDVSYYKPTGTDATIYDPHPDVRFVNDTGHYILFQTYTVGYNLYIELWGVSDGRLVEKTDATQYNYVYPPAAKYVDTTDLAPGVVKQKESYHVGVTGEFWWRVIYPDGKVNFKKWISKYSPWQQVFLRGVEALPADGSVVPPADGGTTPETPATPPAEPVVPPAT